MYCHNRERRISTLKAAIHGPSRTVYRTMIAPRGQRIFTNSQFGVCCADFPCVFYEATR
jgi:hypothetical protein